MESFIVYTLFLQKSYFSPYNNSGCDINLRHAQKLSDKLLYIQSTERFLVLGNNSKFA